MLFAKHINLRYRVNAYILIHKIFRNGINHSNKNSEDTVEVNL